MDCKRWAPNDKKFIEEVTEILHKNESNPNLWVVMFNTLLVYACVRRGYALPLSDTSREEKAWIQFVDLLNRHSSSPLQTKEVPGFGWLVYSDPKLQNVSSDSELAQILGLQCHGHNTKDFGDIQIKIVVSMQRDTAGFKEDVYSEHCAITDLKHQKDIKRKYNAFLKKSAKEYAAIGKLFGYRATFSMESFVGLEKAKLSKHLNNLKFVKKHFNEYINHIFNNYSSEGYIVNVRSYETLVQQDLVELFRFLFWISTRFNLFDEIYAKNKSYKKVIETLLNFERELMDRQLLTLPYDLWPLSPRFREILHRYPHIERPFLAQFQA